MKHFCLNDPLRKHSLLSQHMKNTRPQFKLLSLLVVLGLSTSILSADDQGRPERGPCPAGKRPKSPLMTALDANDDHRVDAGEIAQAAAALISLDKNGDSQLSPNEIHPPLPQKGEGHPGGGKPMMPPVITALDANGDGTISLDEVSNAPTTLQTLDKNNDGSLTPDEFAPRPPRHEGAPGHRPGRE